MLVNLLSMGYLDLKRRARLKNPPVKAQKKEEIQKEKEEVLTETLLPLESYSFSENESWFLENLESLPTEPFLISQAMFVSKPSRFYQCLAEDIHSPNSPRRMFGAIEQDIERLKALFSDVLELTQPALLADPM